MAITMDTGCLGSMEGFMRGFPFDPLFREALEGEHDTQMFPVPHLCGFEEPDFDEFLEPNT